MKIMIETVYKYVNECIDEEILLEELQTFLKSHKEYEKKLETLINNIKDIMIKRKNNSVLRYDEIYHLLIENEVYLKLVKQMSDRDLMLMITNYIKMGLVPQIDQEYFEVLVDEAIKDSSSKEFCWRLAMNYEHKNLDKIEDYLISTKDTYYVIELLYALRHVLDINKSVEKIINTKDKEFMQNILKHKFLEEVFTKEQIEKIKEEI